MEARSSFQRSDSRGISLDECATHRPVQFYQSIDQYDPSSSTQFCPGSGELQLLGESLQRRLGASLRRLVITHDLNGPKKIALRGCCIWRTLRWLPRGAFL